MRLVSWNEERTNAGGSAWTAPVLRRAGKALSITISIIGLVGLPLPARAQDIPLPWDQPAPVCETGHYLWFRTNFARDGNTTDPRKLHSEGLDLEQAHAGTVVYELCDSLPPAMRNSVSQSAPIQRERFRRFLGKDRRIGGYVPGYNTGFADAMDEGVILETRAGLPRATVVFPWASGRYLSANVLEKIHGEFLERQLVDLLEDKEAGTQHKGEILEMDLVCRSRGCSILLEALDGLARSNRQRLLRKLRRLVMIGPDVHHAVFERVFPRIANDVTFITSIYGTPWDGAFLLKRLLGGGPTMGGNPRKYNLRGVEFIDVSGVLSVGVNHHYAVENPIVQADIAWGLGERQEPSPYRIAKPSPEGWVTFDLSIPEKPLK